MRTGVFGGTFDPIHDGHLAAASAAMECAHLDRVLFVPSAQPPHRPAALAPADDRLAMTRMAVDDDPRFEVSDLEVKRGGMSYTADTLADLHRDHPNDQLFLILGWDAARLFSTWHEPETVTGLASVVVVGRPGMQSPMPSDLDSVGLDPGRALHRRTPSIWG
jgi:nicotinate-nucleotide adenylyltransferase